MGKIANAGTTAAVVPTDVRPLIHEIRGQQAMLRIVLVGAKDGQRYYNPGSGTADAATRRVVLRKE